MGGKKLEIWYLSHFQAAEKAQSSLFKCAVSPAFTLLALHEGKSREIWYLSHFKAMKAQSSSCQCTDSPEPLLLAQMRPKSASTRLIDDINGIILLVVSQVPSLAMCEYHTIGHFLRIASHVAWKAQDAPGASRFLYSSCFYFYFFLIKWNMPKWTVRILFCMLIWLPKISWLSIASITCIHHNNVGSHHN